MVKRQYKKVLVLGIFILFIGVAIIPNIRGDLVKTSNQLTNKDYVNAFWKFDEGSGDTAYDFSGHNYDGTIYGASWVSGYSSYALSFDGIDDYVEFDEYAKIYLGFNQSDDLIFSFYFKSSSTEKGIFYSICRGDAYGYNPGVHIALDSNGTIEFQVWFGGCGILMHTHDSYNDDSWHYVEVYYNGDIKVRKSNCTGTIYVDDTFENSFTIEVCSFWNDQFHYAQIGKNSNNSTDYFNGIIDEFKIIKYPGGNKQVPPNIDGPTYGEPGVEYNFTFTTYDPEEDELIGIEIDWGNGDIWWLDGPYASGDEVIVSYAYDEKGTYNIKTRSQDIWGYSEWSELYVIRIGNNPPNAPVISGPPNGRVGTSLEFTFNAVDPDGDDVRYHIEWDDTTSDTTVFGESGVVIPFRHTWTEEGTYTITAKAEDIYGKIGPSTTFTVVIPRDKAINNQFLNLLQNHPYLFPILKKLLQQHWF